jgi:hypothetical protein
MSAKDVFADARGAAVAERTLRAAQHMGVVKSKTGMDGGWTWKLPEAPKMAKKPEDGQPKSLDTFGRLGHLRCVRCADGGAGGASD